MNAKLKGGGGGEVDNASYLDKKVSSVSREKLHAGPSLFWTWNHSGHTYTHPLHLAEEGFYVNVLELLEKNL